MLTRLTKVGGGVGEMLTMADKGGREGLDPPFLADIIWEQPFTQRKTTISNFPWAYLSFRITHSQLILPGCPNSNILFICSTETKITLNIYSNLKLV